MHTNDIRKAISDKSITKVTMGMIKKLGHRDSFMLGYIIKEEEFMMKSLTIKGIEYDPTDFKFILNINLMAFEYDVTHQNIRQIIHRLMRKNVVQFNKEDHTTKILWSSLEDMI